MGQFLLQNHIKQYHKQIANLLTFFNIYGDCGDRVVCHREQQGFN